MSPLETKLAATPEPARGNEPQDVRKFVRQENSDPGLTTIFGGGYGQYQVRPQNFMVSLATHTVALGLIIWLFHVTIQPKIMPTASNTPIELTDYNFKVGKGGQSGGGGGEASKLKASKGTPPKAAKEQIAPPVVLQQQKSKLMVTPTVVADARIPQSVQMGDPLSKLMIPSSGTGVTGGIGSGDGGGVGSGHGGPGVGPGYFRPGVDGVSSPRAIYTPEPEFSEEARKAKYQGAVMIDAIIGVDGRVHNARIVRSLGMGLDEKAMEIVKVWKFDPGKKDGRPVPVQMGLEIDFNLY
jgi:TonB family protein